ncbi:toxin TcdB middle/N-terminal domain-containing protein [Actinomadura sp. 9N215]|uniref:toxin TcdB middle/N-terminal domain-containing protein n=1 Tax=Actinomadura sp. 9N215 TaxID=3375150 RepID=UPI0037AFB88F
MEQSGVAPEIVPLPHGGGAVRGIGDTFSPDLHTGTGSYRIPLWFPRGPGGFQPEMGLVYSSGAGNGPYGMGWHLPVLTIQRRTDRRLPRYDGTDTLLIDGEELVPVDEGGYRARREEQFRRVTGADDGFEVRDRGGRRFLLGTGEAARVEHVDGTGIRRTLAWLVERAADRNGNTVDYSYRRDGGRLYLSEVQYGPYRIAFGYEPRPDAVTDRRSGFDLTTALRLRRVEYRLIGEAEPFRTYGFSYHECPHTRISLLTEVICTGQRDGETAALPTLRLGYTPYRPGRRYQALRSATGAPPPFGLDDAGMSLVDLDAGGLPGVIQLTGLIHRYWPNIGGGFGPPRTLHRVPAPLTLGDPAVGFADMDGNGTADLLLLGDSPLGYVENAPGKGLTRRTRWRRPPAFSPADPDLRLLDLTGDGLVDAMRTGQRLLYLYRNLGADGWDRPAAIPRVHDLDRFPDVFFSDPRVKLADLTGDGLTDIAWVHGGRIDYWPHYGNGRFGRRVALGLTPALGREFDPRRLLLMDVNGDGLADVVHVGADRVLVWANRGGQELVLAADIRHTPPPRDSSVQAADLLGTGTAGLVWSEPATHRADGNYRYLDLTGGIRPYLLASIDDGTGLVTEVEYRPSTEHMRQAAANGTPWATALPFPVQTVTRITQRDSVSGTTVTRRIRYFDGLFDGRRREFRGFGRVEVLDDGGPGAPSARTTSWFHQGIPGVTPGADQEERDALTGKLARLEVTGPDGGASAEPPFRVEENSYAVRNLCTGTDGRQVLFPHLAESVVHVVERGTTPLIDTTTLEYNQLGNVVAKHERWDAGDAVQELVTTMRYTEDTTRWILNLPVELRHADTTGRLLGLRRFYYDGAPFQGLPLGRVELGNLTRREDLVITDDVVTAVYGTDAPDYPALGYHRMDTGGGVAGWGVDGLADGHDGHGNPHRRKDPLGHLGTITHDPHGIFPAQVTDPLGHVHTVEYDLRAGEVRAVGDANGAVTGYRYDPVGRLIATIKPGDSDALPTSAFEYLDGALPLGVRTRLRSIGGQPDTLDAVEYFDGFGRTVQRRSAAEGGQVLVDSHRTYDARGLEAERTIPFFSTGFGYLAGEGAALPGHYRFGYDAVGRVVETITPDGRPSRIRYEAGRITRYDVSDTDASPANVARGHFDTPRVDHVDARGRLLAVEERLSSSSALVTRYGYDPMGRLTSITDARGVLLAEYTHDLMGRKLRVDHVDAGVRRAAHNARGDLVLLVDAAGRAVELDYDAVGRQLRTTVEGTVTETFNYDSGTGQNLIGRLAEVTDPAGATRYSYTARGLVTEKTRKTAALGGPTSFTVVYGYDALERMTAVTHPGGSPVNYEYNERGLLARVPGFVDHVRYNALGQPTELRYANGTVSSFDYDPATFFLNEARITGPTPPAPAQPYYEMNYSYDAVGNPLSISDGITAAGHPRFDRVCEYDALYRLTGVTGSADGTPFRHSYSYDDAGNFRRNDELGPDELTLEPGTNQLRGMTADGAETPLFEHDANGNLTSSPDLALTFDPRGRLVRAVRPDGTVVEYAYDHAGMRVRKRVTPTGGQTTETLYVDGRYEVRDGQATRFITSGDTPLAAVGPDGTRFLHHDALGHLVLVTGPAGEVLLRLGHHAFGTPAFVAGTSDIPYQFLGNELDETGLIYCRARYYHPGLGRFVSPDLFVLLNPEQMLGLPSALNPYAYASNNPIRQADPEGAWWKWVVGGLIIAALVVATIVVGVATGGAGFAFGILLAASIGSALGAGVGSYAAWRGGGDLADGFLVGALVGAGAGAGGYALGAAVGAAGISGAWGAILSGAVQGAVVGAGNGAIVGYAGGAGTVQDVLVAMAVGFAIGAVLGGIAGYLRYSMPDVKRAIVDRAGEMPVQQVDPVTGQPVTGVTGQPVTVDVPIPGPARPFWQSVAQTLASWTQQALQATAHPMIFASFGASTQAAVWHDWDMIKVWQIDTFGGDEETVIVGS